MAKRLFVRGECTDDTWLYCGGPDLEDAKKGLANLLESGVDCLFMDGPGSCESLELQIRDMTDEEVAALPDA